MNKFIRLTMVKDGERRDFYMAIDDIACMFVSDAGNCIGSKSFTEVLVIEECPEEVMKKIVNAEFGTNQDVFFGMDLAKEESND